MKRKITRFARGVKCDRLTINGASDSLAFNSVPVNVSSAINADSASPPNPPPERLSNSRRLSRKSDCSLDIEWKECESMMDLLKLINKHELVRGENQTAITSPIVGLNRAGKKLRTNVNFFICR